MRGPWAYPGGGHQGDAGSWAWEMPRWVSGVDRSFLGQTGSRGGGQRCPAVRGAWTRQSAAGARGARALSPPRGPRGPQVPPRDLGSWGLEISPAAWFLPWFRGPPASWATPVLYPQVAPLPPQSSGLPPARQFPFLPSPWGLFLTNRVEQCRWNQPGVEGPPRIPFPIGDPRWTSSSPASRTRVWDGGGSFPETPRAKEPERSAPPSPPASVLVHTPTPQYLR